MEEEQIMEKSSENGAVESEKRNRERRAAKNE